MLSMTLFFCKKDLMHFMHGQPFGNCLFHYKNALFYILVGITLTISIQYIMCLYLMLLQLPISVYNGV